MRRPKSTTGVALSGGGSRAYVAGLSQLAALEQLGLLSSVDHVAGVSGGAWAAAVHTWGSRRPQGALIEPEHLDWPALRHMPADVPHGAMSRGSLVRRLVRGLVGGQPPYEAWRAALDTTLLLPLGIPENAGFAWSAGTYRQLPRPARNSPTPHLLVAIQGPRQLAPFDLSQRCFGGLDITPSAARCLPAATPMMYTGRPAGPRAALSTLRRSLTALPILHVPAPRGRTQSTTQSSSSVPPFTLADALAVTSFFPGAALATACNERGWRVRRWLGRRWRCTIPAGALLSAGPDAAAAAAAAAAGVSSEAASEAAAAQEAAQEAADDDEEFLLADGGSVANMPLPLLLGHPTAATRVLALFNVGEPLPSAAQWEPSAQLPPPSTGIAVSEDLAALFGVLPATPNPSKDLQRAACFEAAQFAPLMRELQQSLASGRGAVATTRLRTVANPWWGIRPGTEVTVCWSYICRAPTWERRLPLPVRRALAPPSTATQSQLGDASRASVLRYVRSLSADAVRAVRSSRPLDGLPQFPLTRLRLSNVEANALYQVSGWVVKEHAEEMRELLVG